MKSISSKTSLNKRTRLSCSSRPRARISNQSKVAVALKRASLLWTCNMNWTTILILSTLTWMLKSSDPASTQFITKRLNLLPSKKWRLVWKRILKLNSTTKCSHRRNLPRAQSRRWKRGQSSRQARPWMQASSKALPGSAMFPPTLWRVQSHASQTAQWSTTSTQINPSWAASMCQLQKLCADPFHPWNRQLQLANRPKNLLPSTRRPKNRTLLILLTPTQMSKSTSLWIALSWRLCHNCALCKAASVRTSLDALIWRVSKLNSTASWLREARHHTLVSRQPRRTKSAKSSTKWWERCMTLNRLRDTFHRQSASFNRRTRPLLTSSCSVHVLSTICTTQLHQERPTLWSHQEVSYRTNLRTKTQTNFTKLWWIKRSRRTRSWMASKTGKVCTTSLARFRNVRLAVLCALSKRSWWTNCVETATGVRMTCRKLCKIRTFSKLFTRWSSSRLSSLSIPITTMQSWKKRCSWSATRENSPFARVPTSSKTQS